MTDNKGDGLGKTPAERAAFVRAYQRLDAETYRLALAQAIDAARDAIAKAQGEE